MKKVLRFLVPFVILVLPVLVLLLLKQGRNKYVELPYFGNPHLNEKGDTVRHTVAPFSFIDQNAKPFGTKELNGNVYVAEFFFARCPSICPVMAKGLKKVIETYPTVKDLRIVSFSVDPGHDQPDVLRKYAERNDIKDQRWHFLTGNKDSIYDLMNVKGYLILKPEPNEDPSLFKHSEMLSLVDKEGHIRGQYDGTKDEEIDRLIDEIRVLLLSYDSHWTNK